jgi:putative redox protein
VTARAIATSAPAILAASRHWSAPAMVEISVRYEGDLRCRAVHGPSGTELLTDAPVDNHGKGESFSPTDLLAAALPACVMTIIGIVAERHGIDLAGMHARTSKVMSSDAPRRIARLPTVVEIPLPADHPQRANLENAAKTCPVHKSLRAEIDAPLEFRWTG